MVAVVDVSALRLGENMFFMPQKGIRCAHEGEKGAVVEGDV